MKIRLACFGKITPRSLQPAVGEYAQRIERWSKLEIVELPEETTGDRLGKEATTLRKRLEGCSPWIALDSRGASWTSEQWGQQVEAWRAKSPSVGLIIGSADGLHEDLRKECQIVSLGPITLPHSMARLVLLEQLYRAHTIALGLPYHIGH